VSGDVAEPGRHTAEPEQGLPDGPRCFQGRLPVGARQAHYRELLCHKEETQHW